MDFKKDKGIIYLGESKSDNYAHITWQELGDGVIEIDHTIELKDATIKIISALFILISS